MRSALVPTTRTLRACMSRSRWPKRSQAGERAGRGLLVEPAVLADAGGQAHHLAQPVDDDQLAVRIARDHHVKAVGAEVDRRDDFVGDGARGHARAWQRTDWKRDQTLNEDPHPQVVWAFGLRITNCAPSSPSRKSISAPPRYWKLIGSISSFTPWFSMQVSPS